MNVVKEFRQKGQITIPAEIAREVHLEPGDCVQISVRGGAILLEPVANGNGNGPEAEMELPAEWTARIEKSLEELEAGLTTVYEDDDAFFASLDR